MNAIEYIKSLEKEVDPSVTKGMESRFHFILTGDEGGELTVVVNDGEIDVIDGLEGEAKCTVKTKAKTFKKLVNKEMNPMMAVMMGKIKISNQGELLKFAKAFGLM